MLRNYLKIAFRNLKRDKFYVSVNILGLAIGMGVCFIVAFYVQGELSYDTFHEKKDQIFRLTESRSFRGVVNEKPYTSYTLAQQLESEIPEIETVVTVKDRRGDQSFTDGISVFDNINYHYTESEFFDVFDVKLISGKKEQILDDPASIVLSEKLALTIFGNTNVVGKEVRRTAYQGEGESFIITGVFEDLPENSHFQFDALVSFGNLLQSNISINNAQFINYVLTSEKPDSKLLIEKTNKVAGEFFGEEYIQDYELDLSLQPLTDIYLGTLSAQKKGNPTYIPVFVLIAIFILLIAIINYTNLAIARNIERNKEVGIRKVVGASKFDLIKQFLGESLLYSLLSIPLALAILDLFLPYFNQLMNSSISWDLGSNVLLIGSVGLSVILIGLLSSLYPAFILSSFKPVQVFKNNPGNTPIKGNIFRKGLITIQFIASSILIISTVVISQQLSYMQEKNLGFEKELLVSVDMGYPNQRPEDNVVKSSFLNNPSVIDAALSFNDVGNIINKQIIDLSREGENEVTVDIISERVDPDFISTFGLTIIAGSDFVSENESINNKSIILNEKAVQGLGWGSPQEAIGKEVKNVFGDYKIIRAVVEDFHFESVHSEIRPILFETGKSSFPFYKTITLKISPGNLSLALESLKNTWKDLGTGSPLEYSFLEDTVNQLYEKERNISSLFNFFAIVSIALSCIGLLGLTAFTTSRRAKEIGIRKVLGATVTNIVGLLSKDFLLLVLFGFLISIPITFYIMNSWLSDFAYRIEIEAGIFFISGFIAVSIAFITVSVQSIKSALTNPVESLKNE